MNCGLYRAAAFPLLPGKHVRVVVHRTDVCRKDGDIVEVFYPLNTEKFSARAIDEVEIRTDVPSKGPLSAVYSPTHALVIERPAPEHVIASDKIANDIPSTDFRLMHQPRRDCVGATCLSYRPDEQENGYFLLMASPMPRADKAALTRTWSSPGPAGSGEPRALGNLSRKTAQFPLHGRFRARFGSIQLCVCETALGCPAHRLPS